MSGVRRTQEDFEIRLQEQINLLQNSVELYDLGSKIEALRLATGIRTLCHDSHRSKSLLGQLTTKNTFQYVDTALPYNPQNQFSHSGLTQTVMRDDGGTEVIPLLDDLPIPSRQVAFDEWWNGIVIVDNYLAEFSRRDLILNLTDKEGGAHVDPLIPKDFHRLSRENSLGWYEEIAPGRVTPIGNHVPASVRQIAHELLKTLNPLYSKRPGNNDAGVTCYGITRTPGAMPPSIPISNPTKSAPQPNVRSQKTGRNHKCPCGSGKKYKKCCGP